MTVILVLILLAIIAWLLAIEMRFHGIKEVATESKELAEDAAAEVRATAKRMLGDKR